MNAPFLATSLLVALCALGAGCVTPQPSPSLSAPLDRLELRPKKLTFGLYVTQDPAQNPIDPPERFTGYHTALDLEILEDEKDKDVPVYSICAGELVYRNQNVEGYGGVLMQACTIQDQEVTVLYGHLDPSSFKYSLRQKIDQGVTLGHLGDHKSAETSFTRKHLHLSIRKGKDLDLRGYVQSKEELNAYLDPALLLKEK